MNPSFSSFLTTFPSTLVYTDNYSYGAQQSTGEPTQHAPDTVNAGYRFTLPPIRGAVVGANLRLKAGSNCYNNEALTSWHSHLKTRVTA